MTAADIPTIEQARKILLRRVLPEALEAAAKRVPDHATALRAAAKRCAEEGTTEAASAAQKAAVAAYAAASADSAANAQQPPAPEPEVDVTDKDRMDYLESEMERELEWRKRSDLSEPCPRSLFRENNPITRKRIDEALAQLRARAKDASRG